MTDAEMFMMVVGVVAILVAIFLFSRKKPYMGTLTIIIAAMIGLIGLHMRAEANDPTYEGPIQAAIAYFAE